MKKEDPNKHKVKEKHDVIFDSNINILKPTKKIVDMTKSCKDLSERQLWFEKKIISDE